MNEFDSLGKLEKDAMVHSGAIKRVADLTRKSRATVSRTLAGLIGDPDPVVVVALRKELDRTRKALAKAARG